MTPSLSTPSLLPRATAPTVPVADAAPSTDPRGRFLANERAVLERFLPGLDARLAAIPLQRLEGEDNPGIGILKELRGPNLVIPRRLGGLGAGALDVVRIQRAIASRSPSLGIVCTMHNFSASTLVEFAIFGPEYGEALLGAIAADSMFLASGFGEGRVGARPLDMRMRATANPDETWTIRGRKRPCTLSRSMDFLTAGITAVGLDGVAHRAVALIPADTPGIERRRFWSTPVLGGAESDELILDDVVVPKDLVFLAENDHALDPVEVLGYIWLQMCLTSTYVGVCSALVERVLARGQAVAALERMAIASELEACMAGVEAVAREVDQRSEDRQALLARMISVRMATMGALERSSMRSAELLGGMGFVSSPDVAYLLAATRALAFHPPSRAFGAEALMAYLDGGPLDLT